MKREDIRHITKHWTFEDPKHILYTECQNNEKDIKDKIKDILNKLEGIAIAENINFYSFEIIYKLHSNFYIKEYLRFEDYILNTRRGSGGKYPFRQFAGLIKKILVTKIKDESELSELGRALYERMQEPWYFHGETI